MDDPRTCSHGVFAQVEAGSFPCIVLVANIPVRSSFWSLLMSRQTQCALLSLASIGVEAAAESLVLTCGFTVSFPTSIGNPIMLLLSPVALPTLTLCYSATGSPVAP